MPRVWYTRIGLVFLSVLLVIVLVAGWPLYLHFAQGRPLCLPTVSSTGKRLRNVFSSPDNGRPVITPGTDLEIPAPEEWVDYGPVLETGAEGEWDFLWAGTTPASVVKKDSTYYFYYVAADGYRSFDGDARHRAIGVATSPDGVRFSKYEGNPVMIHRPNGGEEEGANSAGVTLDEGGQRFVMIYGAAAGPEDSIVADARYAYSDDGLNFTDDGLALDHCDLGVYGAGDELFPVAVLRQEERWVVYYQPNGVPGTARTLGAAWGPSLDQLDNSISVLDAADGDLPAGSWGNVAALDEQTLVHFVQWRWWPDTFAEVRLSSPEAPYVLSEPLFGYDIPQLKRGVAFLDKDRRTWFMYYNDFTRFWRVRLAPYGTPDNTPPTAPARLKATMAAHDRVELSWQPASDPDTGVVEYRIFRDGHLLGTSRDPTWTDTGLSERQEVTYAVSAVNFHGAASATVESPVRTPADHRPPVIVHVVATGVLDEVTVTFDEAVNPETASDMSHYSISGGITVQRATLLDDGRSVILQTTGHEPGGVYSLQVEGISDQARRPNVLETTTRRYTASLVSGLRGRWLAREEGELSEDVSGYGVSGLVHGATPELERPATSVFDGLDDYVQISGDGHLQDLTDDSFTFSAWVRPQSASHLARVFGRVAEHPAFFSGLSFTTEHQFQATVLHEGEGRTVVTSPAVELGHWMHVAMVVDVDRGELHLYLDGEPAPDSPRLLSSALASLWTEPPRDDRSGAYYIASTMPDRGAGPYFDAYFQGSISDVRLYDRALDASEIQAIRQE